MSSADEYLQKAVEWLAENKPETKVRVYIDMPEVGWIYPSKITIDGGTLTCEYTTVYRLSGTIVCSTEKVTASERKEVPDLSFLSRS